MSSSRLAEVRRRLHGPRTLRTRLVVGIVAFIVALCVTVGVITEIFLSRYLVEQVDQRLINFGGAARQFSGGSTAPGGQALACRSTTASTSGFDRFRGPQQDSVTFTYNRSTGTATYACVIKNDISSDLNSALIPELKAITVGAKPTTIDLAGLGEFRVMARLIPKPNPIPGQDPDTTAATASDTVQVIALPLDSVTSTEQNLALILLLVAGGAIIVGAGVVFLTVRRAVRPLERVAATARKVSTLTLDKGEVDLTIRVPERDTDLRTEIGQVGAALNQMLGHVSGALETRHASETRVRQFVADASHELRTPLAAIRGYAELARRGEHDPNAVSHALRRVESESSRMTTLVEDLLLLARLDSGRPLAREEVDLSMLVVDRVSDARVAGPDHRWQLDLPDEPVTVTGDGQRLHQVLANLLTNARNHTPPGTVVVTSLARRPNGVELTVTDNGPGIPPELQPEIFGRFVRGDSSRSRAAGSTGLGLAIVSAVVSAHGGAVTVESRPGRTTARVFLPADSAEATGTSVPTVEPSSSPAGVR